MGDNKSRLRDTHGSATLLCPLPSASEGDELPVQARPLGWQRSGQVTTTLSPRDNATEIIHTFLYAIENSEAIEKLPYSEICGPNLWYLILACNQQSLRDCVPQSRHVRIGTG